MLKTPTATSGVITYLPPSPRAEIQPFPRTTPARRRAIMQGPSGGVHYGRQDAQDIEVGTDTPRFFFVAVNLRRNTRPPTEDTHTSLPKEDLTGRLPACLSFLAFWALCSCSRPTRRETPLLGRPRRHRPCSVQPPIPRGTGRPSSHTGCGKDIFTKANVFPDVVAELSNAKIGPRTIPARYRP